jgi:hypothetical protein
LRGHCLFDSLEVGAIPGPNAGTGNGPGLNMTAPEPPALEDEVPGPLEYTDVRNR